MQRDEKPSIGPTGLVIRPMRQGDFALGLELCRLAGWNQLEGDWRRLLALEPGGLFVAEQDGAACGTASTTCYGRRTAWIGMILVHPDFRRRGIGTALMDRCIDHLRANAIESIKLDATDQGRPVYLKLGFEDERPIWRYAGPRPGGLALASNVRPLRPDDWSAIARLDREAFDADRLALLKLLDQEGPALAIEAEGEVQAYGFAREGFNASYVGPVVAADSDAARSLVASLLAQLPEGDVFWDVLPDNAAGETLAESLGFAVARRLTRMYLGDKVHPGRTDRVYGAAGFEVG